MQLIMVPALPLLNQRFLTSHCVKEHFFPKEFLVLVIFSALNICNLNEKIEPDSLWNFCGVCIFHCVFVNCCMCYEKGMSLELVRLEGFFVFFFFCFLSRDRR